MVKSVLVTMLLLTGTGCRPLEESHKTDDELRTLEAQELNKETAEHVVSLYKSGKRIESREAMASMFAAAFKEAVQKHGSLQAMRVVALGDDRDLLVFAWSALEKPEYREYLRGEAKDLGCKVGFRKVRFVWDESKETGREEDDLGCPISKEGKVICEEHPGWAIADCEAVAEHTVVVGMSAEALQASWGKPRQTYRCYLCGVTKHYFGGHLFEEWTYEGHRMVSLEDGVVTGWSSW